VKLISSTRVDHEPQYSPDGSRIVFGSNRSGSLEIWVCDSNGSNCTQLTSFGSPSYTASPRWSPDGRLIAFTSTREGHVSSYVINAEGGKPKLLPIESFCGWSRDGHSIYFTSSRSGSKQLWKTTWPPPEQSAVQITKHGFIGEVMESNDGKYLFYSRTTADGSQGIWRMSLDTGDEQQILESFLNNNVALTDQGIYYIPGSQPRSICFLSFVTGKAITIARLPHDPAWGFSITPDGRSLLYSEYEAVRSDLMMVEHFR
jgi:Tol biopolymer transport system component